jgi:hypothetical protein
MAIDRIYCQKLITIGFFKEYSMEYSILIILLEGYLEEIMNLLLGEMCFQAFVELDVLKEDKKAISTD